MSLSIQRVGMTWKWRKSDLCCDRRGMKKGLLARDRDDAAMTTGQAIAQPARLRLHRRPMVLPADSSVASQPALCDGMT